MLMKPDAEGDKSYLRNDEWRQHLFCTDAEPTV